MSLCLSLPSPTLLGSCFLSEVKTPRGWSKPRASSSLLFGTLILLLPRSRADTNALFKFCRLMKADQVWDCQMTSLTYENSSVNRQQWFFLTAQWLTRVAGDDFLMEYWTVSRSICHANKCDVRSVPAHLSFGLCWSSSLSWQDHFCSFLFLNFLQWICNCCNGFWAYCIHPLGKCCCSADVGCLGVFSRQVPGTGEQNVSQIMPVKLSCMILGFPSSLREAAPAVSAQHRELSFPALHLGDNSGLRNVIKRPWWLA